MKGKDAWAWCALQGCERTQAWVGVRAHHAHLGEGRRLCHTVGSHAASSLKGYLVQLVDVVQKFYLIYRHTHYIQRKGESLMYR